MAYNANGGGCEREGERAAQAQAHGRACGAAVPHKARFRKVLHRPAKHVEFHPACLVPVEHGVPFRGSHGNVQINKEPLPSRFSESTLQLMKNKRGTRGAARVHTGEHASTAEDDTYRPMWSGSSGSLLQA